MAGWAKDKVEDVLGGVKDKIGSGALPLLSFSRVSSGALAPLLLSLSRTTGCWLIAALSANPR